MVLGPLNTGLGLLHRSWVLGPLNRVLDLCKVLGPGTAQDPKSSFSGMPFSSIQKCLQL